MNFLPTLNRQSVVTLNSGDLRSMTNENTNETRSQIPGSAAVTNKWKQNTLMGMINKVQSVQYSICDTEEQEKVISILQKRMTGRKDMKRKLDILRNQICGSARRLSPTSAFVTSRLEGKLRPNWSTATGTILTDRVFNRSNVL